ncbi:MAG: thiamine pyrophosphate-binding protein [Thermodesulfobacteriota bacterium]
MAKMTAAQAIGRFLKKIGTEHYFYYNGHANWGMLDAFEYEAKLTGIVTRHECQAVHMADNYWRMKRKPPIPVTCTTTGPGNYNTFAAIAEAFFDSTPMLCLMGGGPTKWFERGGIQETYRYGPEEFVTMFKPITKKAVLAIRPDTALKTVVLAYKEAITGRPGPVVVHLPLDVQNTEVEVEIPEFDDWLKVHPPAPDPAGVARAIELIHESRRPFCYVATGVNNARAWPELRALAEKLQIPVATSFGAKGALPEDHPLSLGVCDRSGTGHGVNAAINADLVIGVGTHFNDLNTAGWSFYDFGGKQKLIHIDIDPGEISRNYPTAVALQADARLGLLALIEAWEKSGHARRNVNDWLDQIAEWKTAWEKEVAHFRASDLSPLHYGRIVSDASEIINEVDPLATVVCDTGMVMNWLPAFFKITHPYFTTCNQQFGQMGFAPPAVVGCKLARPEHPVVVFSGDQSFLHTGLALATATEYGLPGVIIVLNNRTIQAEIEGAQARFGRTVGDHYRILSTGELWNPDLSLIGRALRAEVYEVTHPAEMKPALKSALTSNKLCLLNVDTDRTQKRYAVPIIAQHGTMPFPYTWST